MLKVLLSCKDIDINKEDDEIGSVLHVAIVNHSMECIELLINDARIDLNPFDSANPPLHTAADLGYCDIIQMLLAKPSVDVSLPDIDGVIFSFIEMFFSLFTKTQHTGV